MTAVSASAEEVVRALDAARGRGPAGVAFDADGTLWSGDVGNDVYDYACRNELIRAEARDALAAAATSHGLSTEGTPSRVAARLFDGYRRGVVAEHFVCAVMTWAYAGYTETELAGIAREAFAEGKLAERRRRDLDPILDYCLRTSVRTIVISASPRVNVGEAILFAGIPITTVAAATPEIDGGRIAPAMAAPVPYGPHKVVVGEAALEGHDWLASFGDNVFDVDMLRRARVPVAVHPKPALEARLTHEFPGILRIG